jgi:hypothetical protein
MTWRNPLSNPRFISKGGDYHLSKSLRQTTSSPTPEQWLSLMH